MKDGTATVGVEGRHPRGSLSSLTGHGLQASVISWCGHSNTSGSCSKGTSCCSLLSHMETVQSWMDSGLPLHSLVPAVLCPIPPLHHVWRWCFWPLPSLTTHGAKGEATFSTPFHTLDQSLEGCSPYAFPGMMDQSTASEMMLVNKKCVGADPLAAIGDM